MSTPISTSARSPRPRLRRARSKIGEPTAATLGFLLIIPSLAIICVIILYPLGYTLYLSSTDKVLTDPSSGSFIGLENYFTALTDRNVQKAALNTAILTVASLTIQLGLAFTLAMMLRRPFVGRGLVQGLIILPWPLPTFVAAFAWIWMLDYDFGIVNHALDALHVPRQAFLGDPSLALGTVVMADVWKHLPWTLVVMIAGLSLVPNEQLEAVRVDGGTIMTEIWHVILPTMRPVIVLAVVLRTIWTVNTFDLVFLLTGGGPVRATDIVPIQVYTRTFQSFNVGEGAAIASCLIIALAGLASLYLHLQDQESDL